MNMVKTDMNKKYYVLYIILISVFVLFPVRGYAQYGIGDKVSIEAMVSNHKKLRSLLETRVVLELTTDSLHKDAGLQERERAIRQVQAQF